MCQGLPGLTLPTPPVLLPVWETGAGPLSKQGKAGQSPTQITPFTLFAVDFFFLCFQPDKEYPAPCLIISAPKGSSSKECTLGHKHMRDVHKVHEGNTDMDIRSHL